MDDGKRMYERSAGIEDGTGTTCPCQREKMKKDRHNLSYILITPARNEEAHLEKTIHAVISQTVLPRKWVIVSDGSTDRTDEIANRYKAENNWIELIRMPEHRDRQFAAKVNCFNAGYQRIKNLEYDVIGNLDADITFEEDYIEFLLGKFAGIPELGVTGTPFVENSSGYYKHTYDHKFASLDHVSGACQLFRRECFEAVGGYIPIRGGGIDWTAVTTARMKGWKTRTFPEKTCFHHRKLGTGNNNLLVAQFKHGYKDYYLGGHPLWELCRSLFQMTVKPYVIGGLFIFCGYAWASLSRAERPISRELMKFHRTEQMQRLKKIFSTALRSHG